MTGHDPDPQERFTDGVPGAADPGRVTRGFGAAIAIKICADPFAGAFSRRGVRRPGPALKHRDKKNRINSPRGGHRFIRGNHALASALACLKRAVPGRTDPCSWRGGGKVKDTYRYNYSAPHGLRACGVPGVAKTTIENATHAREYAKCTDP